MTDLPTIIAEVYRACGYVVEEPGKEGDGWMFVIANGKEKRIVGIRPTWGLDAFIRDIVPILKERGWRWNSLGEFFDDQWVLTLQRKDMVHACSGDTPVETCFRAAWEALIPGENP